LFMALSMLSAYAQDPAMALRAMHQQLAPQLASNPFQRPLHLQSQQTEERLQGDIYAVLDQPFSLVGAALQDGNNWCDILILHLNVKRCLASSDQPEQVLNIRIGRKIEQPLAEAALFQFDYRAVSATADYLKVQLNADEGPLGTSLYNIDLQVVALDAERSFLHLSYSYTYGLAANLAMRGYLTSLGRDKRGFSVTGHNENDKPIYIDGMRGVIERNTMRYYLAVEAYLSALGTPPAGQLEQRLAHWQSAVEHYPQLRELEPEEYLSMKREEIRRQESAQSRLYNTPKTRSLNCQAAACQ
jgi:hypothetical protein